MVVEDGWPMAVDDFYLNLRFNIGQQPTIIGQRVQS